MKKQKTVCLADFGILPDTEEDYSARINELIAQGEDHCTYVFRKGIYRFAASRGIKAEYTLSNTDGNVCRTLALRIRNKEDIVLDGSGAKFLFSGNVQPFTLDSTSHITMRNFTVDWEKPPVAEGIVVEKTADYIDLRIDQMLFPCFVSDFCLNFDIGDNESSMLIYVGHTVYDGNSLSVARDTADSIYVSSAERLSPDIFRLYTTNILREDMAISPGDVIVLRHGKRLHAGMLAENCTDLCMENITLHAAPGIGMLFQFCKDLRLKNISICPNQKLGRRVACTRDDGIQAVNCRGNILIEGCSFHGLQDSPINIHGTNILVNCLMNTNILMGSGKNPHPLWAKPGETVAVVNNISYETQYTATVEKYAVYEDGTRIVTFPDDLPTPEIPFNNRCYSLENIDNTPSVTVRNCHFGSCRARGLLVSTPKPVLIENNYFESAGSAILLQGDYSVYFESGGCHDVTIRNNVFTDLCCLSRYENSLAMVNISPQVPRPMLAAPYHKNIRVEDNVFSTPGTPVIYAFDAGNLSFCRNTVYHSERIGTITDRPLYFFAVCPELTFRNNTEIGHFTNPPVRKVTCTMKKKEKKHETK